MVASICKVYRWSSHRVSLAAGKQRHFGLFPLLLGVLLLGLQLTAWADISGTVSLPAGDVAQAGGQDVTVYAIETTSGSNFVASVRIPEGQSSVAYSIRMSTTASTHWRVSYDCGLLCDAYVRLGYYASTGTTWDKSAATVLPGGADHSGIDMTLLSGDTISGQVFLPQGEVAPNGGLWLSLLLVDNTVGFYQGRVKIEEGDSSVAYKRVVPSLATANWSVRYSCTGPACTPYYEFGWYSAGGTTWSNLDATLLPGGSDHGNVDLTLLYADHISGRIFLPAGEVVPANLMGMRFNVSINDIHTNDQFQKFFIIPPGDSSVSYDMVVPYIPTADWTVAYICNDIACQPYIPKAYYLDGGMTLDESLASLFPSGADYSHIDLIVAQNIPNSCSHADEAITGPLTYSGDYFCSADASITAGENSVVVGSDAYVVYASPKIRLVPGFAVADHGIFRAGKNLLP